MSMGKFILPLTALASLTMASATAFADIDDTYAESCTRYGGEGTLDKAHHLMVWIVKDGNNNDVKITESFKNKRCVGINMVSSTGSFVREDAIKWICSQLLEGQTWIRMSHPSDSIIAEWYSNDGRLLAAIQRNGMLQVTTAEFLKSIGKLRDKPEYAPAPSESADSGYTNDGVKKKSRPNNH